MCSLQFDTDMIKHLNLKDIVNIIAQHSLQALVKDVFTEVRLKNI